MEGVRFKFTLESADDKTDIDQEKTNDDQGLIVFDKISFSEEGEYTFTVKEVKEALGFIQYSTAEYKVIIEVINTNGVLSVKEPITVLNKDGSTAEGLNFINTYILEGSDQLVLGGKKTLAGDRTTVNKDEFSFGLYDAAGQLLQSVKNDEYGNFLFSALVYDQDDVTMNGTATFQYTIQEIPGNDPYITYDETVYNVTVTVKDNDEGGVEATYTLKKDNASANAVTFQNTYTAPDPVTVTIDVTKTVENKTQPGITAADFEILLYEGDTQRSVAKTGETGKAGFQITYGIEDVGKTVTYKVMEKKGKVAGVTYDETVHTIQVTVAAKEDGTLYTIINEKEADSVAVSFQNVYEKPATPVTGDNFPVILVGGLLLISAAAIVVLLMIKKQKKGGKYAR